MGISDLDYVQRCENDRNYDRLVSARKDRDVRRLEIKEIRLLRQSIEQLLERLPLALAQPEAEQ
jgi:hypothetical protein